jgi:flagellar FliJ protein
MPKFRLAGVLRARQAQETVAKAAAARARADADAATELVHHHAETLDAASAVNPDTAQALAAALSARQAMAAVLSASVRAADEAAGVVTTATQELAAAGAQRKAMEKLAERHALTRRKKEEHAESLETDDLVTSRYVPTGPAEGESTWQ